MRRVLHWTKDCPASASVDKALRVHGGLLVYLLQHLRYGRPPRHQVHSDICQICGSVVTGGWLDDGDWQWPASAMHYIEAHHVWTPMLSTMVRDLHARDAWLSGPLPPLQAPTAVPLAQLRRERYAPIVTPRALFELLEANGFDFDSPLQVRSGAASVDAGVLVSTTEDGVSFTIIPCSDVQHSEVS